MDKDFIISEIKRTAVANDGKPLGMGLFEKETGIKKSDWYGRYWRNWSEALRKSGYSPNRFGEAPYPEQFLLEKLIQLSREISRFPIRPDRLMKRHQDKTFPSEPSFARLGTKAALMQKVREYCETHDGYEDVLALCPAAQTAKEAAARSERLTQPGLGSVYLMKSGRFYKIGKTNAVGRRERELAIQLPEKASCVHEIKTDDPSGIEAYWHRRFADKRKNGEWFELAPEGVAAFKRRKFM